MPKISSSIILLLLTIIGYAQGQSVKFITPIGGTYLKDFYIVKYVDHDGKDPFGGNKTYPGHKGTDFEIRGFSQMDSLVPVFAAARGQVIFVNDGLFDRNTNWDIKNGGNYIILNHNDTLYTYYYHLKLHSIKVKLGDSVNEGQTIAYVGSSGMSAVPHLHFEVRTKTQVVVDPFIGRYNKTSQLWKNQLSYDKKRRVIASGFVPYVPKTTDSLQERIQQKSDFNIHDSIITHWIQIAGMKNKDILRTDWIQNDNLIWSNYITIKNPGGFDYNWFWIPNPVKLGMGSQGWICEVYLNNKLMKREKFSVTY
jgi:hypothetical protein